MLKKRSLSLVKVLLLIGILLPFQRAFLEAHQFDKEELIAHVQNCIQYADKYMSKLHRRIFALDGMSSNKVRCLLNNLCSLKGASYLEVGCYRGATFVAANYKNQDTLAESIGIDNWSEFGGPRATFYNNINRWLDTNRVKIVESDCFAVDTSVLCSQPISIYFYDGGHSEANQKAAFTYFNEIFSPVFIAIVDDWNRREVRKGTFEAFEELNYKILFKKELFSEQAGPLFWWDGLLVAVIEK